MAWLLEVVFWSLVLLMLYVYAGYPLLLIAFARARPKTREEPDSQASSDFAPTVSLIIAAHNEEKVIAQKLENTLALDYPMDKLEIIVVSDGSTDKTADIVSTYRSRRIQLVNLPKNVGKACAQNEAVERATGDILLFTDAEAFLNTDTVRNLIKHFQDDSVGCIVGRVIYLNEGETVVSEGEGFYWRYELFLRQRESKLGNLVMGSGAIIGVRRELFQNLDSAISEDFILPMKVAILGYRTVYEPGATARIKLFQTSPYNMFKTKVRTITLDTRVLFLCRTILNPFRYPLYAWGLISHKLLRWLVPYFLIFLFAVNVLLLKHLFYQVTFGIQLAFYVLASLGYLWQRKGKPPYLLSIPFFFCLVNLAALVGVARFLMGKKSGRWVPVRN